MSTFVAGQRWISETEPELGLGRILSVQFGRVEVEYPAAEEKRLYTLNDPPLKRVAYHVGDQIQDEDANSITIDRITDDQGVLLYHGDGRTVYESELQDIQTFDKPEMRLTSGHVDSWETFDLRLQTLEQRAVLERSPVRGLLGGRIDLIPHQLYIASEVSRRDVPRLVLADEVGLGKTIEACLILHRMLVTGKITRALIIVPDPLIHQWFVELLRRFSLTFRIFDEDRCRAMEGTEEKTNPFLDDQLVICGIDFLLQQPGRAIQVVQAGWDMLIVDEAHHLEWSADAPSPGYLLVEAIARATPSVLLLTATPEQLGPASHFARLRLLDPHRYPDLDSYLAEHDQYEAVVKKTNKLIDTGDEAALQKLLDCHGPGRVMFRNTRASMEGFPKRILHKWPLKKTGKPLNSERESISEKDPRAQWLAEFLRKNPTLKVLVITQSKEEVIALQKQLRLLINVNTALFHENMPILQCDRQAAWFAEKDGARLLIASEIGGEGRNFQFVQHLVLIHLPDDPEMLEQRIGRLDRIGQFGDIHIHVPYFEDTPEADRVRWYHEGLNAFEEALSGSHELMMMFHDRLDNMSDALIKETKSVRVDLKRRIERGRDRLLELNSCRPASAAAITEEIGRIDSDSSLERFLLPLFDHFGVNPEHLQGRNYLLQRAHLFDSAFPLPVEKLHITYDRKQALVREDITLMSWDHPMVYGAMDLLLGSEKGNAAIAISPAISGIILQAVFVLECVAPPGLELPRFLPPTPIDVIIGEDPARRPKRLREPKAWEIVELQPLLRSILPPLIEEARQRADKEVPAILKKAREELDRVVGAEARRLSDLQKMNDHIRDDEIEATIHRLSQLHQALENGSVRLDSVLVIKGSAT